MKAVCLLNNFTFLFIILSVSLSAIPPASCENYTVGDEEKWNTGVNFVTWSQKYNFTVGDILEFQYVYGEHDVYEVTEDVYRSCNTSDSAGVLRVYASGNDKINLTEAKRYWFICNIPDHCRGGMKFGIEVKQQGDDSSPVPVATHPPPPNSGAIFARGKGLTALTFLIVLRILICI